MAQRDHGLAAAEAAARTRRKEDTAVEAAAVRVIAKVDEAVVEAVGDQGVDEAVVRVVVVDEDVDSRPNLLQHQRAQLQRLATPKFPLYISTR